MLSNSFRVISYWGARQCPTTDSCTTTLSLFLVFSTVDSCFVALLLVHCLSLFTCLFCHFKLWYINRNKSFVTIELIDGTVFHLISENLIRVLFCREKIRHTHAIAGKQRANSHNFKIKNLNLLTITSPAIYFLNRSKSLYINKSSMRVSDTFRKIIDCFWRKHCRNSPFQTSSVDFFKSVLALFFSIRALQLTYVRLWQMLIKVMFQFVGSLLHHLHSYALYHYALYHLANENVSVKSLSLIYITSILTIIKIANCSCRLWKILPKLQPKIIRILLERIPLSLREKGRVGPYWEKPCPLSWVPLEALSTTRRPRAQFFPIRTSWLANTIYIIIWYLLYDIMQYNWKFNMWRGNLKRNQKAYVSYRLLIFCKSEVLVMI